MKGLKMLSVLAFMTFSFTANASSQIQNENEVTTTSEVATNTTQVSDDEGASLLKSKEDVWGRRKYFNINLVTSQDRKVKGVNAIKDSKDWAVGLTLGRTYYMHKKPILNMIKIGIDWTYLDLTYAKYKKETEGYNSVVDFYGDQQAEYAMAIGPSVTVNPIDHLKVGAYIRYMPACSAIFTDDDVNFQFASGGQFGVQASWKMFALGFESRWQSAKYKCLKTDEYKQFIEDNPSSKKEMDKKTKLKTNSFRFFIGFRF